MKKTKFKYKIFHKKKRLNNNFLKLFTKFFWFLQSVLKVNFYFFLKNEKNQKSYFTKNKKISDCLFLKAEKNSDYI